MSTSERPQLERAQLERTKYWEGQALRSGDFNHQFAMETQKRWWHNRALHGAFGIVRGFDVAPPAADGIAIAPGLAYDCVGRPLRATSKARVPLPTYEGDWTLVVRYRSDDRVEWSDCPETTPAMATGVEFLWVSSRDAGYRAGVQLARFVLKANRLTAHPSFRSIASRRLARPRCGHGRTVSGKTAWEPWAGFLALGLSRERIGTAGFVSVTIDTSSAGFTATPCYRASVHSNALALTWFDWISDASPAGFTQTIYLATTRQLSAVSVARRHLHVCWFGIEMTDPREREAIDGTA